jgi:hypothetical protein
MYQTATNWLFKQLWEEPKDKMVWYAILEQAKQMEKEQIINAFESYPSWPMSTEEFYNETYGTEKEG